MKSLICGTHHVALKPWCPEKFAETVHFYRDILGLETVREWGPDVGCMLWTGNSILEIVCKGTGEKPSGSIDHFSLATQDVAACVAAVRAAGYPITVETGEVTLPSDPPFSLRRAFCVGPMGEEIEFFTELNPSTT